jgi:nitrogen regulatory protein PII
MKKIEAFIKAHRLDDVSLALHRVEWLGGMTVTDARGFGRGRSGGGPGNDPGDFHQIVRIEVFCSDELASTVVETIEQAAHTGLRGDGKVYVIPVEEAVRISTGERGREAV